MAITTATDVLQEPVRLAPLPTPPNFPVAWQVAGDEANFWVFDRMHAPEPLTHADAAYYQGVYDHGITMAARHYGLPLRALTRRINTYLYLALAPEPVPPAEAEARAKRAEVALGAAMAGLADLWKGEFLPEIERYLAEWESRDLAGAALPQLTAWLEQSIARAERLGELHMRLWFPMMIAINSFDELYRELFPGGAAADPYRLLQGFENKTVAGGRALWQLSRRALMVPAARQVLEERAAADVPAALSASAGGRGFLEELRAFLETWGQRGDRWGWSHPSWIEDPTPVIKNLKDYVTQPDRDLDGELAALAAERVRLVAATRERLSGYPGPVAAQFEFLLRAAQDAIVLTEDHSYWIDFRSMYQVRRVYLEFGRRFIAAGVLDRSEDVFLLTPEEVVATAAATPFRERRPLAAARRAEMAYFRTIAPPPALGTPPAGPSPDDPLSMAIGKFFGAPPQPSEEPGVIRGNAGSPGRARGTARVIRSLAEADRLQPGDVLVAETTAPPWTPLFASAAAIVTDTGGILSHCAIVAREYGIPSVVGTGSATVRIQDGQLLEVDGDAGLVRVV
jgi:phosphohistidine swiveling domain-containing protein